MLELDKPKNQVTHVQGEKGEVERGQMVVLK